MRLQFRSYSPLWVIVSLPSCSLALPTMEMTCPAMPFSRSLGFQPVYIFRDWVPVSGTNQKLRARSGVRDSESAVVALTVVCGSATVGSDWTPGSGLRDRGVE